MCAAALIGAFAMNIAKSTSYFCQICLHVTAQDLLNGFS
jgi:hypothetical protein